jgi:hypothetical protein
VYTRTANILLPVHILLAITCMSAWSASIGSNLHRSCHGGAASFEHMLKEDTRGINRMTRYCRTSIYATIAAKMLWSKVGTVVGGIDRGARAAGPCRAVIRETLPPLTCEGEVWTIYVNDTTLRYYALVVEAGTAEMSW